MNPTLRTVLLFGIGFIEGRLAFVTTQSYMLEPTPPHASACVLALANLAIVLSFAASLAWKRSRP